MRKLVDGIHSFQEGVYRARREMFAGLAKGQKPEALFITCADSRIDPNLITQSDPGEIFILRNAGNIVPPYGAVFGGEAATIEYAITVLNIKDIIICGHTDCGAIKALVIDGSSTGYAAIDHWLNHAEGTRRIVNAQYADLKGEALQVAAAQTNVLMQLDHLRTHPSVAVGLADGSLRVHGWFYDLGTGVVSGYDAKKREFSPMVDVDESPQPSKGKAR